MGEVVRQWSGRESRLLRQALRMTVREFAGHLGVSERTVSKWEKGAEDISPRPEMQAALDTSLAKASADRVERFRHALNTISAGGRVRPAGLAVYVHRFLSVHVGVETARSLMERRRFAPMIPTWLECRMQVLERQPHRSASLYTFGFGTAIVHLSRRVDAQRLGEVVAWQYQHSDDDRAWAAEQLAGKVREGGHKPDAAVIAGPPLYWVEKADWTDDFRTNAVRLLSTPGVLADRDYPDGPRPVSERAEQYWLTIGIDHLDLHAFGMRGVSVGYASWAGHAYLPVARADTLSVDDLIGMELTVRSFTAYCRWLIAEHAAHKHGDLDRAWLRTAHDKLTNPGRTPIQQLLALDALMKAASLHGRLRTTMRLYGVAQEPSSA